MAMKVLRLFGLIACIGLSACGGGHRPTAVMVVDEGFDISATELKGRVVAAYTETCVDTSGSGGGPADDAGAVYSGPAFDALKQQWIAGLSVPDKSCHLSAGISAKSDPLASIAQYKARWNSMLRANQRADQVFTQDELAALQTAFAAEFQTFAYHGTSTAGTVAHEDPNVRLVLVERKLASESTLQAQFTCLVQSEIDQIVALLTDSDVFTAFVNQPVELDNELAEVAAQYNVGIVNQSFGAEVRATLEMLQATHGCPAINLLAYFTILNKARLAHAAAVAGPALLTVQSAGNDGAEIDRGADSLACDIGDPLSLLVGSYDTSQVRSTFSNFGACVDLYAPGESIIDPYAGGWLLPVDGTSFASPMVVRYVWLTAAIPFSPGPAKTALLGLRASDGSLPISFFPDDFFYRPSPAPASLHAMAGLARLRPPPRFDVQRFFRPLFRLRAARRHLGLPALDP
jgi:subtilisin family serine protease